MKWRTHNTVKCHSKWVRLLFSISNRFVMISFCNNWWSPSFVLLDMIFHCNVSMHCGKCCRHDFHFFWKCKLREERTVIYSNSHQMPKHPCSRCHVQATQRWWCGLDKMHKLWEKLAWKIVYLRHACVCTTAHYCNSIARKKIVQNFYIRNQLQCIRICK